MAAREASKIYCYLELNPTGATRNWFATNCLINFHITSFNGLVEWVQTSVCHLSAACVTLETLGTDATSVNLGVSDKDFVTKVIRLTATQVPVALGDQVGIILAFTNTDAVNPQSFAWRPDLTITLDSWAPDRGLEVVLAQTRKRRKQRQTDDDEALLLLDDEPYDS